MNETCEHLSPLLFLLTSQQVLLHCTSMYRNPFLSSPRHSLWEERFRGQESVKSPLPFLCHYSESCRGALGWYLRWMVFFSSFLVILISFFLSFLIVSFLLTVFLYPSPPFPIVFFFLSGQLGLIFPSSPSGHED